MENFNVYEDIEKRTGGDIYIGVVGPVRTGKSTFIKNFMEQLVLPDCYGDEKKRMIDELPQSAAGKTVMTTEPKFVPSRAAEINLTGEDSSAKARVRLIDCVGFTVDGVSGFEEDGSPRLVNTPWSNSPMPFQQAARLGTQKVIREHSTVGVLVTSDGSFTDIPRSDYAKAEERTVEECKQIGKPFVILLNSSSPQSEATLALASSLSEKYERTVLSVNCLTMNKEDILSVLSALLFEFPVVSVDISIPEWMQVLEEGNSIIAEIASKIKNSALKVNCMKDCSLFEECFSDSENISPAVSRKMNLGDGTVTLSLEAKEGVFYKMLSEECGEAIANDCALMRYVSKLTAAKNTYERVGKAFAEAEEKGFALVCPDGAEIEKPESVRRGESYGIRLRAEATGYGVIKVNVISELNPVVGTQQQSEDFARRMGEDYDTDRQKLWSTNMFGKTLKQLVDENLTDKMQSVPLNVRIKMRKTLTRIINEGRGGVICILL